jgi:hypothetical protein
MSELYASYWANRRKSFQTPNSSPPLEENVGKPDFGAIPIVKIGDRGELSEQDTPDIS